MLQEPEIVTYPGQKSLYLYSSNYQTVDKLVSKCGRYLNLTENEYYSEMKELLNYPEDFNQTNSNNNKSNIPFSLSNNEKEMLL